MLPETAGGKVRCATRLGTGGRIEGVDVAKVEDLLEEVLVNVVGDDALVDQGRIEYASFFERPWIDIFPN